MTIIAVYRVIKRHPHRVIGGVNNDLHTFFTFSYYTVLYDCNIVIASFLYCPWEVFHGNNSLQQGKAGCTFTGYPIHPEVQPALTNLDSPLSSLGIYKDNS